MCAASEIEERLPRTKIEAILASFDAADWARAMTIAEGFSNSVTGWKAEDLLQEAMRKLLGGERVWRPGLHPLVVLKTAMYGVAFNARRHNKRSPVDENVFLDPFESEELESTPVAHGKVTVTPEDVASGKEQMERLYAAIAGDEDLELLVMAWADGIRGAEAREMLGWNAKKYDAVRNRLLRKLAKLDPERRAL
jgi:DNA-directed RNA polymerase specialized sigma24 family protein